MPQTAFSLLASQAFTNSVVTGNGTFPLWVSAEQSTPQGNSSIKTIIDYATVLPEDPPGPVSYALQLVIEGRAIGSNNWYPVAYQFEPFNYAENGRKRVLVAESDIFVVNDGVDDIVYVGGRTIARTSARRGRLPATWRASLLCTENGFGGAGAFQSAIISVYGETY